MNVNIKRNLDCDNLFPPGRRRDICRGHKEDGSPLGISEAKRRAYLRRWAGLPPEPPKLDPTGCLHRGEVLRQVRCQLCPKTKDFTDVPVYSCPLHGECMKHRNDHAIKDCKRCPDRTPPVRLMDKPRTVGAGFHREGWPYAVSKLRELHREDGLLLDDFVEQTWTYHGRKDVIARPWAGIFHHTPDPPAFWAHHAIGRLTDNPAFKESLKRLKVAFTLSEYLAKWIREHWGVPAVALKYAAGTAGQPWDAALAFRERRLFQAGYYQRDTRFIHRLDAPGWRRLRVLSSKAHVRAYDGWCAALPGLEYPRVEEAGYLPNARYDEMLASSVVVQHVLDASANTAIVECIARSVPLVVNRHPAVEEYLRPDYPLYHDGPESVPALLTQEKILAAHEHLKALDKSWLTAEAFAAGVQAGLRKVFVK